MRTLAIIAAGLLPALAAAGEVPRRVPCAGGLAKLEQLTSERFDDAWPLCRLYGNFDPATLASFARGERASVQLSRDFEEDGAPRHVLVVCRQTLVDGQVADSHGSQGSSDVYVYGRDATGWTLLRANRDAEQGGSNGSCARVELVLAGPKRPTLLMGGGGTWQGYTKGWDRLFSLTGEAIRPIGPTIRTETDPDCDFTPEEGGGTRPCNSYETRWALKPGADRDWHDLVLTTDRASRREAGGKIIKSVESVRHSYRLWHYVGADRGPLGEISEWSGSVGGTPIRLALVRSDPERDDVVGWFRSPKGGVLVAGNLGTRLDEFDGARLSGSFEGKLERGVFEGAWRRSLQRGGVPFRFTRVAAATGPARPGRYEAVGATLVLTDAGPGKVGITGKGAQARAGGELSGSFAASNGTLAYTGKDCRLELTFAGDVVGVRQLTPTCGDAGLTFDSEDVGPFLRVGD